LPHRADHEPEFSSDVPKTIKINGGMQAVYEKIAIRDKYLASASITAGSLRVINT